MTSFLTEAGILEHLAAHPTWLPLFLFKQGHLPRLTPEG
jgi:hypothetical protein